MEGTVGRKNKEVMEGKEGAKGGGGGWPITATFEVTISSSKYLSLLLPHTTHYPTSLQVLPHVGTEENCETKKAFFMGYIVHKMLMCSLGRLEEDDRDHFGKKRWETDDDGHSKSFITVSIENLNAVFNVLYFWYLSFLLFSIVLKPPLLLSSI
jgi:DNA-directed RNA polymerase beta subunit